MPTRYGRKNYRYLTCPLTEPHWFRNRLGILNHSFDLELRNYAINQKEESAMVYTTPKLAKRKGLPNPI